jgi:hypothetical protein
MHVRKNPPMLDTLPVAFEGSLDVFIPTLASQGKTDPTKNGFGVSIGTLRTEYPRKQASSQDNSSCLPAGGSSKATMCPRGSGSRSRLRAAPGPPRAPVARGSTGAATCPRGSGQLRGHHVSLERQHPHSGAEQLQSCHVSPGLYGLQANKQISPDDPAIMISIEACTRISSKALRGKGCSACSQGVQQVAH